MKALRLTLVLVACEDEEDVPGLRREFGVLAVLQMPRPLSAVAELVRGLLDTRAHGRAE